MFKVRKKGIIRSKKFNQKFKPLIVEFEYFQLKKTNTTCKELFDLIREYNYYIFYLEYDYQVIIFVFIMII